MHCKSTIVRKDLTLNKLNLFYEFLQKEPVKRVQISGLINILANQTNKVVFQFFFSFFLSTFSKYKMTCTQSLRSKEHCLPTGDFSFGGHLDQD